MINYRVLRLTNQHLAMFRIEFKWWPGTESNRRRRPFQGRLPDRRSGLKSTVIAKDKRLMALSISDGVWMIWAALGASMFAYCSRAPNLHRTPFSFCSRAPMDSKQVGIATT